MFIQVSEKSTRYILEPKDGGGTFVRNVGKLSCPCHHIPEAVFFMANAVRTLIVNTWWKRRLESERKIKEHETTVAAKKVK
jgi:hypothetical protein